MVSRIIPVVTKHCINTTSNQFIKTFIKKYESGGILPIWDLSGNYTGCMIGYHAIPVIADAYLKGIRDYDIEKAYEAMKHSAEQNHLGLASYKKYGLGATEVYIFQNSN